MTKGRLNHLLKLLVVEITFFYAFYLFYQVFSMLAFGEAPSSFMYSFYNTVIAFALQITIPTIVNVVKYVGYKRKQNFKAKNYVIVQLVILILFAVLTL